MMAKEAPPDRRSPPLERADGGGVKRKRRLANPEKSGGAKSRDCRAPGCQPGSAMFAGLREAKSGKPDDAKVGPSP